MKKILILANHILGLYSFRRELVLELLNNNYQVIISAPYHKKISYFIEQGCVFLETPIDRRGVNLINDIKLILNYWRIIKYQEPAVVLTYTIKPNVYGGIVCRIMKVFHIANVTGLGTSVENKSILQRITLYLYKIGLKKARCVFFQNKENKNFMFKHRIATHNSKLIPGSGVNLCHYKLLKYPNNQVINFLFISRIMKEKGIDQYLEVAKYIKPKYPFTNFYILGNCDESYMNVLEEYEDKGFISYQGRQDDVREFHRISHCTIHPTYYPEGMSNVLLESAACGRPIITTNRSGCKEIVDDGVNGYVIEPKNSQDLIKKVERFISLSFEERKQMGLNGRVKVEREFNRLIVVDAYLKAIKEIVMINEIERSNHIMDLLYAHDHRLYKYNNNYYSNGSFSIEILMRYTNVFNRVKFLSRQIEVEENTENMTLATCNNVSFIKIPDFKSLKLYHTKKKAKSIIEKQVLAADCVIARNSLIGELAIKFAKKHNKPYLIEVVACPWDALWNHSFKGRLLAPYKYLKLKKIVSDAPFVLYVTNEFLQNRYPTKGKKTNCSNVALTQFDNNVLTRRLSRINNKHENEKIILGTTAAVNVRYKGQQYIIQALGYLKKQGVTKYEYQLVGGGDQTYLKSIARKHGVEDQIKFIGAIPHDKVFTWLETIDLYVQPSRQEGLPRALIEAMSRGVPAFGARTAGIPELLDNEFIFSNTKKNINEICNIIESFDKQVMYFQAIRNYEESMKYRKEVIDKRREEFLIEFKNSF